MNGSVIAAPQPMKNVFSKHSGRVSYSMPVVRLDYCSVQSQDSGLSL